ncbi:pyruvate dehydrogenase complex dihydrolipoamide acetyltransferase [Pacificimonas sp. WHA3]|uniref:Acetyltransferase component of pyruvate dehydrogenase complex n=1 Tax=Pacificimonas pallii TaxID=2827236 RepID=A0ABS6SDP8_9SPHN|nr:pyruvate dehydrogenase complex dihydrolipoamide acetyltransferase [Pacificimonas pallii]MBV7256539.1 pyruvate dehydrogenase complex dihydrolipoamide acetyltransferase [Pacificimonas pallii]
MPITITMPALSPTMEHGTLAKWIVKPGDTVAPGDLLAEIETDKATMEVEAVDEGTVAQILIDEGTEEVAVGTAILLLAEEGEDAGAVSADAATSSAPKTDAREEDKPAEAAAAEPEPKAVPAPKSADKGHGREAALSGDLPRAGAAPKVDGDRVNITPLARRIAEARGLDLSAIKGSGPKGRIVKADVADANAGASAPAAAAAKSQPSAAPAPAAVQTEANADAPHEIVKLSNVRKVTARRLTESKQTVPHFYLTLDCNLDKLLKLRGELNADLVEKGVKLSVNDLLIKALAVALTEVPEANVQFAGDNLIKYDRVDVSMAVAIDGGLITPIIRNAAEKRLSSIATESKDLAGRAREGKLKPEEFMGGTCSISNLGMYGIKEFGAVINPPQGMIMAIGAGEKRPHVVDEAVSIATVMSATGSFDHRAIDGATGAELMAAFQRLVESPMGMLA